MALIDELKQKAAALTHERATYQNQLDVISADMKRTEAEIRDLQLAIDALTPAPVVSEAVAEPVVAPMAFRTPIEPAANGEPEKRNSWWGGA